MAESAASLTAMATALMRARHTRRDPLRLIEDPWGDTLVPEAVRGRIREAALAATDVDARARALAAPDTIVDDYLRGNAAYANVILRTRYAEDALRTAVANGVDQYVVIGAGFDSFALRRPSFARHVDVYEVDHPATQDLKRRRLAACAVAVPPATHFVAADLGKVDLGTALAHSPFRAERPTFFSWLGVTMYLPRAANVATLRAIAGCGAAGSELVFTYLDERVLNAAAKPAALRALEAAAASAGEPFLSGFAPAALAAELRQLGLTLREDLNGRELIERYDSANTNGLRSGAGSHIAWARTEAATGRGAAPLAR